MIKAIGIYKVGREGRTVGKGLGRSSQKTTAKRFRTSCHTSKFEHLNFLYIYPISYKIAKKANPQKRICPYKNDITTIFYKYDTPVLLQKHAIHP